MCQCIRVCIPKSPTQSHMHGHGNELTSSHRWLRCFDASMLRLLHTPHAHTLTPSPFYTAFRARSTGKSRNASDTAFDFLPFYFFAFEWHLHKWSFPWKRGRKGGWNAPKPVDSYFRSSNKQIDICNWRATLWKIDFTRMPVCHIHKQHFLKKTPHNSRDRKIYPSKCAAFRDRRDEGGARGEGVVNWDWQQIYENQSP